MATAARPGPGKVSGGVPPLRAGQGHSYFWRKLHSLSGIVPIGAFLVEHFISNSEAIHGPVAYAGTVRFLNSLPWVPVLEWGLIFLPLLYHAFYGFYIWYRGESNVAYYPWGGNWLYTAQRWTGLIAFIYIFQHVYTMRFTGIRIADHPAASFAKVQHQLSNPWMLAFYIIGITATSWHFAYGIWLFAAKWGITPGARSRRRLGYACTVFGIAMAVLGIVSALAFISPAFRIGPGSHPASSTAPQSTQSLLATPPISLTRYVA